MKTTCSVCAQNGHRTLGHVDEKATVTEISTGKVITPMAPVCTDHLEMYLASTNYRVTFEKEI